MLIRKLEDVKPYVTKDESIIYEFFHPIYDISGEVPKNIPCSIALAIIKPKRRTVRHVHFTSNEIYYITKGRGIMLLGENKIKLEKDMLIHVPPKTEHNVKNLGEKNLEILCVSYPPYRHEDTKLLE
jgi:mannose-6-phosphate isomerase-like protein (cupin superfamily)